MIKTGIFFNVQNYEPGLVVLSRENAVGLKGLAAFEDRAVPFTCGPIFHAHKHLILPLLIIKKLKSLSFILISTFTNLRFYQLHSCASSEAIRIRVQGLTAP